MLRAKSDHLKTILEISIKIPTVLFTLTFLLVSSIATAKRAEPKPVKPLSFAGLKYEALHWSQGNKIMTQNGGYVRLLNGRNLMPICTKQVYVTQYDEKLEKDVQDNFITRLIIRSKNLIIESEKLPPIKLPLENFCD